MCSKNAVAVVMGGYVNGYSIIKELSASGVKDIWLFDYGSSLSRKSNKITGVSTIQRTADSMRVELFALRLKYESIVLYPTDDNQLLLINEIYDEISEFCFIPFNRENLVADLDKENQYRFCESLDVPYPKTIHVVDGTNLNSVSGLLFPLIVKPNLNKEKESRIFRAMYIQDMDDLKSRTHILDGLLEKGITFLVSEYVPGDDTNIYAYAAYRSKKHGVLNEWVGKKLNQFPDLFGVFSSASNEAPEVVISQGRALIEGMNLNGFVQPEFKYDARDGKYKLMEINLRSMMWNRVGFLSGVPLHYTQWLDAMGMPVIPVKQDGSLRVHFVYMKHEIINLLSRGGYLKSFVRNVFGGEARFFAVFSMDDIKPFFYDILRLPRTLVGIWLRRLRKQLKSE